MAAALWLLLLPGPAFGIFSVVQLLLPVMSLWLQRSHGDHSYWDAAAANFKHAIGLCCELVVEHVNSYIHSGVWLLILGWRSGCGVSCLFSTQTWATSP